MARSSRSKVLRRNKAVRRERFNNELEAEMREAVYQRHCANIQTQKDAAVSKALANNEDLGVNKIDATKIDPEKMVIPEKISAKMRGIQKQKVLSAQRKLKNIERVNRRQFNTKVFNVPLAASSAPIEIDL